MDLFYWWLLILYIFKKKKYIYNFSNSSNHLFLENYMFDLEMIFNNHIDLIRRCIEAVLELNDGETFDNI